jgi:hypothetical protein
MTEIGMARHPQVPPLGTIRATAGPNSWRVLFDGNRTVQTIHRSYLEPLSEAQHMFDNAEPGDPRRPRPSSPESQRDDAFIPPKKSREKCT